ncbi:DUF4123 domain-containing protein [Shewanella algae]|uniref:DUF4123 domain-containing protein n=1 Tax=Shewanella algae TaxID=38313 RepID=UPI00313D6E98
MFVQRNDTLSELGYWLLNPLANEKLLPAYYQQGGVDAVPLFQGTLLESHKDKGPWLVPARPELLQQAPFADCPILALESHLPRPQLLAHLKSLLLAACDGERVVFRFYDPRVLQPMLPRFSQVELGAFLGPITRLSFVGKPLPSGNSDDPMDEAQHLDPASPVKAQHDSIVVLHPGEPGYTEHADIWWQMKPEHLAGQSDIQRHIYIVERQLWRELHPLMSQQPKRREIIKAAILRGREQGVDEEDIPVFAAARLGRSVSYPMPAIAQGMRLNQQDFLNLAKWMEHA